MTPLDLFLITAADLYETNPEYRAELDTELTGPAETTRKRTPMRVAEVLDEIEWLTDNGMPVWYALEQVGGDAEHLERVAYRRGRHALARRIGDRDPDHMSGGFTGGWAREWLAGRAA